MELIAKYSQNAHELAIEQFRAIHSPYFLVKRPSVTPNRNAEPQPIGFKTTTMAVNEDPLADQWQVLPLKFPSGEGEMRLSIGRAPGCDLLVRLPFVSKIHAYVIQRGTDRLFLKDNGGANGTFYNRNRLPEGSEFPISPGGVVGLGGLNLELMTCTGFYRTLIADCD